MFFVTIRDLGPVLLGFKCAFEKNFEIEMKHAKEVASKNALELVTAKLAESRYTYEEELENISRQFEEMQQEVARLKEEKIEMKREDHPRKSVANKSVATNSSTTKTRAWQPRVRRMGVLPRK